MSQPPILADTPEPPPGTRIRFPVIDYNLDATLRSGQTFRWRQQEELWTGVVGRHWVALRSSPPGIEARTAIPVPDWDWLAHYLQVTTDLESVLATFPNDEPLLAAVRACPGLRLLRQDPWECLASFLLSSTKQIVQIQQVVEQLCRRLGSPVMTPPAHPAAFSFPSPAQVAAADEPLLRECRMGFRAPYLLAAARQIANQQFNLDEPGRLPLEAARERLMTLPGVGPKIADCVLLFAYGQPAAFPIDVWIGRTLEQAYFNGRKVPRQQLVTFARSRFGPHAGYAQQYLFHSARLRGRFPG